MRYIILVTLFLFIKTSVTAQNYHDYLTEAFNQFYKGEIDKAKKAYGVYKDLTDSVDTKFESLLVKIEKHHIKSDMPILSNIVFFNPNIIFCNGVYEGPEWEYDYTRTALYHDLGNTFSRNLFEITFEYRLGQATDLSEYMNIIMLSSDYREFGIAIYKGYLYIITDNHTNYYSTPIKAVAGTWQKVDVVYNNGDLNINGNQIEIRPIDSGGDNVLSSIDFSCGDCFKGWLRNIIVKN